VDLRLAPDPDAVTVTAVAQAVAEAGVDLAAPPAGYRSAWRRAALLEAAYHSDPVAEVPADRPLPASAR